jgi:protein disulfide-isomerase
MNRRLLLALGAALAIGASASTLPYDEAADAKAQLQSALAKAHSANKPVLVIFGANWCEDCRALDQALREGRNAALLAREFELVKVDVGRFDRNLDIAQKYGNPIRKGIPAAVIVSPDDKLLYATRAGELADARRMNEGDVYAFFAQAVKQAAH